MLLRCFVFFSGVILTSIGLAFIIIYLNLLNMGYSFSLYVNFIIRKWECLLFIFGIFLIFISVFKRKEK